VYPYYYDDVVHPGTGTLGVIGLAIRNGLMVVSMIVSLMWAISHRPAANAQANA
jgi:putative membrane protein